MSDIFECKLQRSRTIAGIQKKNRQSLYLRRWYERRVEAFKKRKSSLNPEEFYKVTYDLSEMIDEYVNDCFESSGGDGMPDVKIDRLIRDFAGDIVVVRGNAVYWSGILSMSPWDELHRSEDGIIEQIVTEHVFIDENYNLFFDFNEASSLNSWLRRNWDDGDVSINCGTILHRIACRLMKMLQEDDSSYPRYQEWVQAGKCPKCKNWHCDKRGECPDCGKELVYYAG